MAKPTKLKHQLYLCHIPGCPPAHALKRNLIAYRFVILGRPNQQNFVPAALLNLARLKRGAFLTNQALRCSSYGLSFYTDKQTAILKLTSLIKKMPHFQKRIGNAVGEIQIKPEYGLATQPTHDDHFDLHEFENNQLANQAPHIVWRSTPS